MYMLDEVNDIRFREMESIEYYCGYCSYEHKFILVTSIVHVPSIHRYPWRYIHLSIEQTERHKGLCGYYLMSHTYSIDLKGLESRLHRRI